jgi:hypothetical protein
MKDKIDGRIYDPNNLVKSEDEYERRNDSDYVCYVNDDEFVIGQSYEEKPAQRMECLHCGGKQFIVGQGSYFTAIKCPTCLWEVSIHEG